MFFLFGFAEIETVTPIAEKVAEVEKELGKYKNGEAASIQKKREFQRELDNAQACQLMRELPFFCPADSLSARVDVLREAKRRGIAVVEGLQYWTVVTLSCISCVFVLFSVAIFLVFLWKFCKRPFRKMQSESEQKMAQNKQSLAIQRELLADLTQQVKRQQQALDSKVAEGTTAMEAKIAERNEELEQKFSLLEDELETRVERKKADLEVQLGNETRQLKHEKDRIESIVKGLTGEIAQHERKLQQKKAEFQSVQNTLQQSKANLARTQSEAASAQQKLDLLRAFKK